MLFPEDRPFGIRLCGSNLVIDVSGACDDIGTNIIVWHQKLGDNANQRWIYENNKLRSLKSGLILSAPQLEYYAKAEQQHDTGMKGQSYKYV
ncbi:hypothetical protein BGZ80_000853 [Entomortierella chlamydospora]|uniref:Ricin B lectin domain-containing protein n=1 Tax=Entomortierella chlamydospora TaxID=101097 RepID=A0A9P6MSB2_9FUNG|nr:hypothetical protein BGZ80_000853 [Entomortierella chlamydospora]